MGICRECGKKAARPTYLYCSNKCQTNFQYSSFIKEWRLGHIDGGTEVNAKSISGHVRRYLAAKYSDGCALCGWSVVHKITGKIPLEIDHIDGNSENNIEENLRMICPNCHSLTSSFRNLNKGNGRSWRVAKYVKVMQ